MLYVDLLFKLAPLAQLAEHAAVNRVVVGSSPTGGARKKLLEISQGVFSVIFAFGELYCFAVIFG